MTRRQRDRQAKQDAMTLIDDLQARLASKQWELDSLKLRRADRDSDTRLQIGQLQARVSDLGLRKWAVEHATAEYSPAATYDFITNWNEGER